MQHSTSTFDPSTTARLLSHLARSTLESALLERINEAEIYQITQGWQREVLLGEASVVQVRSLAQLHAALENPYMLTLFVPKSALPQDEVVRALANNHLAKTIFWEI